MNFKNKIQKFLLNPTDYARKLGAKVGKNTYIPDCRLLEACEPYLVTIGDNCQITMGVRLYTHGGGQVIRNKVPDFDTFGKIKIGDYVYIGNNSLIMPGVTIENHVIVAAGSVVTKSIPSGYVVGGNPAKIICTINEYISRNEPFNMHSKGLSAEEKRKLLLEQDKSRFISKGYMKP